MGHHENKNDWVNSAVSLAASAVCLASPHMGTWKLNEAKSKFAPGSPKNHTVVYTAVGDVTVDGVDAQRSSASWSLSL